MAATNGLAENPGLLPEDPALLRARLDEVEALYAQVQVQFRELRTWYDKLIRQHRELLWSDVVLERVGLSEAAPGPAIADADRANGHIGGGFVLRYHVGGGAFATVFSGTDADGRPCAVKRIPKYRIRTLDSLKNVAGELRALRAAVGCPNLVWVRGVVAVAEARVEGDAREGEDGEGGGSGAGGGQRPRSRGVGSACASARPPPPSHP